MLLFSLKESHKFGAKLNRITKNSLSSTGIIFILALALIPNPAWSMKLVRFATLAPEGSAWMDAMHALDDEIREKSGGEVGFKFYPNMSMGDEKDVLRKMRLGQLNGAGFTGFGLGEILPDVRVLELPYLFNNEKEVDYVTERLTDDFAAKFAERGFILLGWADVGWIYFLSQSPVAEPKDLQKLKVWMWEGDPLAKAYFAELGQSPVPLSVTDVHMSLQTGLVNAVYCSPLAALLLQWFTNVKYISDIPFTNSIGAVLLDRRTFQDLEPASQKMILETSRKVLRNLVIQSRKDNVEAHQLLLKEGLIKVTSTPEQREKMHKLSRRVHERLVGRLYSRELLNKLYGILAEYRSTAEADSE